MCIRCSNKKTPKIMRIRISLNRINKTLVQT